MHKYLAELVKEVGIHTNTIIVKINVFKLCQKHPKLLKSFIRLEFFKNCIRTLKKFVKNVKKIFFSVKRFLSFKTKFLRKSLLEIWKYLYVFIFSDHNFLNCVSIYSNSYKHNVLKILHFFIAKVFELFLRKKQTVF